MEKLKKAAITSEGLSRRCKDCMYLDISFTSTICFVCAKSYREGFVKGVNWGKKHKK